MRVSRNSITAVALATLIAMLARAQKKSASHAAPSRAPGVTPAGKARNFSTRELARRVIERRAFEAVIWGMPAVNAELMFQAMVQRSEEHTSELQSPI